MYLSQSELNLRSKYARRDIASPYEMHRTLSRVLHAEDDKSRFLWRLERRGHQAVLLLQSAGVPDWSRLEDAAYLSRFQEAKALTYWDKLQVGQIYTFALKANPTVRREGKRLGLVDLEAQMQWLHRQGIRQGFTVVGAMVSDSTTEQYRKSKEAENFIRVQTVRFDGHLKVSDAAAFRQVLNSGLGHAKAFGCGLLTLAKA